MRENTSAKYEPHVMVDIVDPGRDGSSPTWKLFFSSMLVIEVILIFAFIWNAWHSVSIPEDYEGKLTLDIIFANLVWKRILKCVFILIMFCVIPTAWYTVAGSQQKLEYNTEHSKFRIRIAKGIERFSKYGSENSNNGLASRMLRYILKRFHFFANPRDVIISFTGINHFDRETGLTTENINESTWVLDHPYKGDHGFNLFAVPKLADTDEVIVANLLEAISTLGPDHLVSTTMISGHNTSYIMDDVEEQLKLPNLSPVREKALWSIYNKFKNRVGTEEPLFIIHIGLPPAVHEHEHIENMRRVRDEFELTLNEVGIETVLIKDPEDLAYIINGMFTGNLVMGKDIIEY